MSSESRHPSLEEMIAEVKREIALRENVYPGLITRRKMKRPQADEHMARIRRVLYLLEWLHGVEALEHGMPRPADMIAALVHIERMLQSSTPGSLGENLRVTCTDVLTGLPGRDSKQQEALRKIQQLFVEGLDHASFRLEVKKLADRALS